MGIALRVMLGFVDPAGLADAVDKVGPAAGPRGLVAMDPFEKPDANRHQACALVTTHASVADVCCGRLLRTGPHNAARARTTRGGGAR